MVYVLMFFSDFPLRSINSLGLVYEPCLANQRATEWMCDFAKASLLFFPIYFAPAANQTALREGYVLTMCINHSTDGLLFDAVHLCGSWCAVWVLFSFSCFSRSVYIRSLICLHLRFETHAPSPRSFCINVVVVSNIFELECGSFFFGSFRYRWREKTRPFALRIVFWSLCAARIRMPFLKFACMLLALVLRALWLAFRSEQFNYYQVFDLHLKFKE